MGLKIKWNDDRLRTTTTAILLLTRDHLSRGVTDDLVALALASYRADPDGYKADKAGWPDVADTAPLTKPAHILYYQALRAASEKLLKKIADGRVQFNSLLELDNYLVSHLGRVR